MSFKKIQLISPLDIDNPEEGYIYFGRDGFGLWEKYSNGYYSYITTGTTATGTAGTAGSSGKDGLDGSFMGSSGTSGSSGLTGTSGIAGSSGKDGKSGTTGTSGTSGKTGTSGLYPDITMKKVYEYLELPYFNHDFDNIEQITKEDDEVYGIFGDHKIRKKLEPVYSRSKELLGKDVNEWIWNNYTWFFDRFKYNK